MRQTLQSILSDAERDGFVAAGQSAALSDYLSGRGVRMGDGAPSAAQALEDSEQPRFVRGFHDILITIGILVLLGGLVGIFSFPLVAVPVIIGLSEIFVRRQRLALPSVVLSVLFVLSAMTGALLFDMPHETNMIAVAGVMTLSAGVYHWRYRTPISLAGVYFGAAFLLFVTTLRILFGTTSMETAAVTGDLVVSIVSVLLVVMLFAVAMRYDLSDPARVTRRSDVAFWLHLGTAPLLLHVAVGLFSDGASAVTGMTERGTSGLVVASVLALMAVGLVIDRRAFVTSGLFSLGVALGMLLQENLASLLDIDVSLVAIAVGVIVLSIGLFWQPLRRVLLGMLPEGLTRRLPPVR